MKTDQVGLEVGTRVSMAIGENLLYGEVLSVEYVESFPERSRVTVQWGGRGGTSIVDADRLVPCRCW